MWLVTRSPSPSSRHFVRISLLSTPHSLASWLTRMPLLKTNLQNRGEADSSPLQSLRSTVRFDHARFRSTGVSPVPCALGHGRDARATLFNHSPPAVESGLRPDPLCPGLRLQ